jgi:hypothetical protein
VPCNDLKPDKLVDDLPVNPNQLLIEAMFLLVPINDFK